MSEKRFEVVLNEFDEVEYIMDKKLCEDKDFAEFMDFVEELEKDNEQLQKQIQIYEQLISNSYVGEQETLDGWIGKYEIWETELQKYKEKIKGVCYEQ